MRFIVGTGEERKLYDTDKAVLLAEKKTGNQRIWSKLYVSKKGNYFRIDYDRLRGERITPLSKEEAENHVLQVYGVDKFIEIFGEVEEA